MTAKALTLFLLTTSAFLFSCQRTEKIKPTEFVAERKTDPQMSASMQVAAESHQISITKKSLGKPFLLIPTVHTSGQMPTVEYLKPIVVSFEKSGPQVGLFNLTKAHLYSTIQSDRLLQTFEIAAEDDLKIKIDLGKGFTSLVAEDNFGLVEKSMFKKMLEKIVSGDEPSFEVKDSFIRSVSSEIDSIFIDQIVRTKTTTLKEEPNPSLKTKSLSLETTENSTQLSLEIRPYLQNPNFKSKVYDKEQRIGYFINFVTLEQEDEPTPQITYWDTSAEQKPIQVHISLNAPEKVIASMQEGILYWNRVFGKEVLKVAEPFDTLTRQTDRSIFVYWIPWETAGFARANFQTDPLTGEIRRGQVFMTSSWYQFTKKEFPIATDSEKLTNLTSKCDLNQRDFAQTLSLANQDTANLTADENAERISQDTIRIVLAHEMGHALGLRHNFAGSSTNIFTDDEVLANQSAYLMANNPKAISSSTTVMDYTPSLDTAMNGAYIKNNVMVYDQKAIAWAYLNTPMPIDKYNYCSDEHIMLVNADDKKIYGCERFDQLKNSIRGELESILTSERNKAASVFNQLLQQKENANSYFATSISFEELLNGISFNYQITANLYDYLYKETDKSLVTKQVAINALLPSIKGGVFLFDPKIDSAISMDSKAIGGYAGIIERLNRLESDEQNHFYENQVNRFFKNNQLAENKTFTDEEFQKIKDKMLSQAKEADKGFALSMTDNFPIYKMIPILKEGGNASNYSDYVPTKKLLNDQFDLGDIKPLLASYENLLQKQLTVSSRPVTINGQQIIFTAPSYYISNQEKILGAFAKSNWSKNNFDKISVTINEGKSRLKKLAMTNSIHIFSAFQMELPTDISSDQLRSKIQNLDWSKITDLSAFELNFEVDLLKDIENLDSAI